MTASIWAAAMVAIAAAMAASWRGFLTVPAALVAALAGAIVLISGGWAWGATIAGSFIVTSLASRRRDRIERNEAGSLHSRRNIGQVLANGSLPALLALLHGSGEAALVVAAFLGSIGAVAGDTWASAMARFAAAKPRLITTGKPVPAGTPGAVTLVGVLLAAAAAVLACTLYFSVSILLGDVIAPPADVAALVFAALTGALSGSLFDSYLGAARQALYRDPAGSLTDHPYSGMNVPNTYCRGWRWLNNDLVNFASSVAGPPPGSIEQAYRSPLEQ